MRVLLIADVGTNAEGFYHIGDEAMLYQTVRRYHKNQPKTKLSILSRSISHSHWSVQEFLHLNFPAAETGWRSPVYCLKLMSLCWLQLNMKWNFFKPHEKKFLNIIDQHQVFHFTGGGNIYSHHTPWLYYVFFLIWYGKATGKTVLLSSQTIGPFRWFDGLLVPYFLNLADQISIREPQPFVFGLDSRKISSCLDAAYDLAKQSSVLSKKTSSRVRIGLSLHDWGNSASTLQTVIIEALQKLSKHQRLELILLPHVIVKDTTKWDLGFMTRLVAQLPKKLPIKVLDYQRIVASSEPSIFIKTATAELDLLIATRYHALVFALSSNVPAISFVLDKYYTQKNSKLFEMIYQKNYQRFLLPLEARTLVKSVKKLSQNLKQEKALLQLKNVTLTVPAAELAMEHQR